MTSAGSLTSQIIWIDHRDGRADVPTAMPLPLGLIPDLRDRYLNAKGVLLGERHPKVPVRPDVLDGSVAQLQVQAPHHCRRGQIEFRIRQARLVSSVPGDSTAEGLT